MAQEINYRSLGKRKILLVEDVELNQVLARHIMEAWGFEVIVANNGKEAVDKVHSGDYDLVLMDIQMPCMDGIEATLLIRTMNDAAKAKIPIVALTANLLNGDGEKYLAVGMNDYLGKPYDESKLFLTISKNLKNGHMINGYTSHNGSNGVHMNQPLEKLYNLEMVNTISGGDEEFVKTMVKLFLETMPLSIQQIKKELQGQNWEAVSKLAHKMKSTVDSMGIELLKEDIRMVEANAKKKENVDQIPAKVNNVVAVLEKCMAEIKKDFAM